MTNRVGLAILVAFALYVVSSPPPFFRPIFTAEIARLYPEALMELRRSCAPEGMDD